VVERDCGGLGDEKVVSKIESPREFGLGGVKRYVAKGSIAASSASKLRFGGMGRGRFGSILFPDCYSLWPTPDAAAKS